MSFIGLMLVGTNHLPETPDVIPVLITQFGFLLVAFFIYYFSTKRQKSIDFDNYAKPVYKTLDVLGQERSSIVNQEAISLPQSNKIYPLWIRILIGLLILIFITTPIIFH